MTCPLYQWPEAARFGRVVPKSKFYERGTIRAAVRDRFISEVQRITWAYKLADATIHLRGDAGVPEIQVFTVDAKDDDVSDEVLAAVDKAVRFPTIFEINRANEQRNETRTTVAYKQLSGAAPKPGTYFSSGWQAADTPRVPLPPALDLPGLYAGLLTTLLPIPARPGERVPEAIERIDQARRLEREIAALERRLRNEPQLNRKVELRRELRAKNDDLAELTNSTDRTANTAAKEDPSWTS